METKTENSKLILIAIIAFLLVILFMKGCGLPKVEVPQIVQTKEVKGKFEVVKPEQKIIYKYSSNNNEEFLQSQINELLAENQKLNDTYLNASDSLKTVLYDKAITLNSFTHTWNNDTINATASGVVRGEVESIKLDYTIKSQKVEVPKTKETVLRLLGGLEVGTNFVPKVLIGFQNRKGSVLQIGYDTKQQYYVGYHFSIWNIKR